MHFLSHFARGRGQNMILHLEWCHLICYVFCAKHISARTQLRWVKNCNLSCMKQNCARVAWAGMGYKLQPELCETELCLDSGWVELGCVINCRQAGCLPATHHASCLADLFSGKTLSALHSPDDHPHSSLLLSSNDLNIHYPTPQFMPSHNCIVKTATKNMWDSKTLSI